jgi:hypothetical protein
MCHRAQSQGTLKEVMCRGALSVTGHRRVPPEPLYSRILLGPLLGGKGKVPMTKVIERVQAHYEVQDVEMGKVYRWCPARCPANVSIECICGEEPPLSAFRSTCGECGADHAAFVGDLLDARPEDKGDHPWRYL